MTDHILEEVKDKAVASFNAGVDHIESMLTGDSADKVANDSYQYAHSHTYPNGQVLENIAILKVDDANPFPKSQEVNLVQVIEVGEIALNLVSNVVISFTNLLNVGSVAKTATNTDKGIAEVLKELGSKIKVLTEVIALAKNGPSEIKNVVEKHLEQQTGLTKIIETQIIKMVAEKLKEAEQSSVGKALEALLKDIFKYVVGKLAETVLADVNLSGQAKSIRQFADQFQTIVVPDVVATANNDDAFAMLQVSGPNPLVIERVIDSLPNNFAVTDAKYKEVMGDSDSLALAITEKRLYLVDYKILDILEPGQFPMPKHPSAPLALFAIQQGDSTGALKSVALQLGQVASAANPVFYPSDGDAWQLAKLHVQSADGNYHELISHLGLTHLLIEPFAVSTHRMLDTEHPVFKLLLPHLQGTLFINNAAVTSLISPEGTVDSILAGTIESDWKVVTTALGSLDFEARMLPNQLKDRHVADKDLPLMYPYRDDAMDLWNAINVWTNEYVSLAYDDSDQAVRDDAKLQAWVGNLTSPDGGGINGLGRAVNGKVGIISQSYLADVLTMVIFTASAQHAAVNFTQLSVMSYTPAMPLACYEEAPTSSLDADLPEKLATLPPLQQAFKQLLVGQLLGGVYFTRLGDYDRHQRGHYFGDKSVQKAQNRFRDALSEVEATIGQRNLNRPNYSVLLPSRIPQSINI